MSEPKSNEERRAWIDAASYEDLLRLWRHAPVGSFWFENPTGQHFVDVMWAKKEDLTPEEQVAASKRVGW